MTTKINAKTLKEKKLKNYVCIYLSVGRELITDVIVTDTSGKTATK